jgi:hypothetical protein
MQYKAWLLTPMANESESNQMWLLSLVAWNATGQATVTGSGVWQREQRMKRSMQQLTWNETMVMGAAGAFSAV